MKRIKAYKTAAVTASLETPLISPYFKPRRLVSEINFHLKVAALACMAVGSVIAPAQAFEPVVQLSSLDVSSGFRLDGVTPSDGSGVSVSAAGDVNGDGIDDIVIGASQADANGNRSGSSYVVFGSSSAFASTINLSSLDVSTGFRLDGKNAEDRSGYSVSAAGDVNGDGIDDLLIGAYGWFRGNFTGSSYVVFGSSSGFAPAIDLSSLNGTTGFRLDGVNAQDLSGSSVSAAGDVNADGIDDLLIGAHGADPHGFGSGSSYVVFGSSSGFASSIDLSSLNGSTGFRLDGVDFNHKSGRSVSAAGDVNHDGIDDLLIGAPGADTTTLPDVGSSYVVFGRSSGFASAIDLSSLNGSTGFRLDGVNAQDRSGSSVSAAGDVNGDGIDDLLIGAPKANTSGGEFGAVYVVFGRSSGFASAIPLASLNGSSGFRLEGVTSGIYGPGRSVSAAGDVNHDGIDDLLIGANLADSNGVVDSGSSYVVFGSRSDFASTINLSSLDGSSGFRLDGQTNEQSGNSVSAAGDVNGDGIDDLLIGAYRANPNDNSFSGSTYIVFGAITSELTIVIAADAVSESDGPGATTATVSRNSDTTLELTVTLSSNDTSEATAPVAVTIATGQSTSPVFNIDAIQDSLVDGTQTVTITASAADHADGSDTLEVKDEEASFIVTPLPGGKAVIFSL